LNDSPVAMVVFFPLQTTLLIAHHVIRPTKITL
jgi:hypothetical protein